MIQEAKIMSKSEVKNYIDFFKKRKKEQFDFSEYSREIHNEYVKIETSIIEDYNEKLKLVEYRRKRFEKKICDCGMKMRYIKEHGFWGCPDYQNKYKKHNTFKSVYSYFPIIYSVPFNWLNTILRELNIDKKATTKELLKYLLENNYDDLRLKYREQGTNTTTNSFKIAKENSIKTEMQILKILEENEFKVIRHIYIKYKLSNQNKYQFCIPDLVASLDNYVFLIEVKEDEMYINKNQLGLYCQLLKKIMKDNNDKRELICAFVVGGNSKNYLKLDELSNSRNSTDIIDKLMQYEFKINPLSPLFNIF